MFRYSNGIVGAEEREKKRTVRVVVIPGALRIACISRLQDREREETRRTLVSVRKRGEPYAMNFQVKGSNARVRIYNNCTKTVVALTVLYLSCNFYISIA